jgi:hypothetical protein
MIVEDKFAEKDDLNYDHMGEKVTVSHDDAPEFKLSLQTIGRSRKMKHILNFKRI